MQNFVRCIVSLLRDQFYFTGSEPKSDSPISSLQDSVKFEDESSAEVRQTSSFSSITQNAEPIEESVPELTNKTQSESHEEAIVGQQEDNADPPEAEAEVPTIETVHVDEEHEAAVKIQAAFRGYQVRRTISREPSPRRGGNSPLDQSYDNGSETLLITENGQNDDSDCCNRLSTESSTLRDCTTDQDPGDNSQQSSSNSSRSSYKSGDSVVTAVRNSDSVESGPGLFEIEKEPEVEDEISSESPIISRIRESIEILEEDESSSDSDFPGLSDGKESANGNE